MVSPSRKVEQAYALAKERYAELEVDVEQALDRLSTIALSLHCWQGDDVGGFENAGAALGGGLAVTGNYPGKARNADELRADLDKALALIPGRHRLNLHASYAETNGRRVERNELTPEHFHRWVEWARARRIGLDFNPTYFAHPRAASGFTLAHPDPGIRRFWVEHGIACRRIGAHFGRELGTPCITNVWVPDGFKDLPVDRKTPRERLRQSLDKVFAEPLDPRHRARRRRAEAVRHRLGSLCGRLPRVLPGLCHLQPQTPLPGRRPFPPDGDDCRQDLLGADLAGRSAAARQPGGALGQRPCGPFDR